MMHSEPRPSLCVTDLVFQYRADSDELFDGFSHEFRTGAITAVTGPSGRGKSTLLYVLGLMLRPTAGIVSFRGEHVAELPDAERSRLRAQEIGFVFQDSVLDPYRTVIDSVIEPAHYAGVAERAARRSALNLLEQMGVAHVAGRRPGQISGGQAQRVAVCRALVNDPSIILADEPTGNLDRDNAEGVIRALKMATLEDRTVIIATHDPFVLDGVDRVVQL